MQRPLQATIVTYMPEKQQEKNSCLLKSGFHVLCTKVTQPASKEGRRTQPLFLSLDLCCCRRLAGCSSYKGHIGVQKTVKEACAFACLDDMMHCWTFWLALTLTLGSAQYFLLWVQIRHLNFPTAPVAFWQMQFLPLSSKESLSLHTQ